MYREARGLVVCRWSSSTQWVNDRPCVCLLWLPAACWLVVNNERIRSPRRENKERLHADHNYIYSHHCVLEWNSGKVLMELYIICTGTRRVRHCPEARTPCRGRGRTTVNRVDDIPWMGLLMHPPVVTLAFDLPQSVVKSLIAALECSLVGTHRMYKTTSS